MARSSAQKPDLERSHSPIIGGVDVREIAGCTCLRLRRSSRTATQLYDAHLSRAGLTIGQFGMMAQLHGVSLRRPSIPVKELAGLLGMDPTTLLRALRPLEQRSWVAVDLNSSDRRSRLVRLTDAGRTRLAEAVPHWQAAQTELRSQIGEDTALVLNGLLHLAGGNIRCHDG